MKNIIPEKLNNLAKSCTFPLYVVGGACRDFLANLESKAKDYDICAPIGVDEFVVVAVDCGFTVNAVYKNTGTVKLTDGEHDYEFTSFRSDEYVRGVHSPSKIYFTDDIKKDALRRDFKCNAVYYDIMADNFVDPLGGIDDIKNKRITTVACAEKVFGEDGLRLMRLCRQAAQLGFTPSQECLEGARKNAALIKDIAPERIWAELNYILSADAKYGRQYGQYNGLILLKESGVLPYILPELAAGDGMPQRPDFHDHDVLEHSFRCVKYAHPDIRLAALLHDVGKPHCFTETGKFTNHEVVGAQMSEKICDRLRISSKIKALTSRLIRQHMYDFDCQTKENKVRRQIVENYDILDKLLNLKQADFSACKDNLSVAPCVEKWRNIEQKMKDEGAPFSVKELKVRGNELIGAGISPDKTSKTLKYLLGECVINPSLNSKQTLVKLALTFNKIR
jgi:tRNA nucleotidyltransferase (CCA-adding enzyme)